MFNTVIRKCKKRTKLVRFRKTFLSPYYFPQLSFNCIDVLEFYYLITWGLLKPI